jgi:hypothetical protein
MKTNERLTGTETSLEYRAERAIFNAVNHEVDLYLIEGLTPYRTGYLLNYRCNKTGKHFLVMVWSDSSNPLVFVNN